MKKLFRALSLCLTLALCVFGSTAALAEAPAATPAPQDERVITDVSPLEDQIRNIVGFTTSTGGPYDFEQADHRSAVQAYGAKPAEGAVALTAKLQESCPDVEIELQEGGQPIYYYLISVE